MDKQLKPEESRLLNAAFTFAQKKKVKLYLVGGYLRDRILKREKLHPDIDFCLKKGSIVFGRSLAREIRAGFVVLDREHGSCRLVKKTGGKVYTLDFTDFRGKDLLEDLLLRDFTINAMALALEEAVAFSHWDDALIDPYGARRDIKRKVIRMVHSGAFDEDPLRVLRAFSLASIFGFTIAKETIRLIRLKCQALSAVSGERIRDELFKILEGPDAYAYFSRMDKLKVLDAVMPEIGQMRRIAQGPYHHLDVWKHSLETVRQLELLIQEFKKNKDVSEYLGETLSSVRTRGSLMKLGALLHDIGKPKARRRKNGKLIFHGHERLGSLITEGLARRLHLSNGEIDALKRMVFWHLRPGYLGDSPVVTPRAAFRYFRDAAFEGASILLLSMADQRSTKGRLTTRASRVQHEKICSCLIKEYFRKAKAEKPARLVNGDELMRACKLTPSPLVGKILSELQELQAIGKIHSKAEAFKAAQRCIERSRKLKK